MGARIGVSSKTSMTPEAAALAIAASRCEHDIRGAPGRPSRPSSSCTTGQRRRASVPPRCFGSSSTALRLSLPASPKKDKAYRLKQPAPKHAEVPQPKKKGARFTPVSRRKDRPDAIAWFLRHHPEVTDAQISRLIGTTKSTIESVRSRQHWNAQNLKPVDPVTLGLCSQIDLDFEVQRAAKDRPQVRALTRSLNDTSRNAQNRSTRRRVPRPPSVRPSSTRMRAGRSGDLDVAFLGLGRLGNDVFDR